MIPSRYEQYMDIAGQVAKTTVGQEFLTVGGLCFLPETASVARERARHLPKWRDSDVSSALEVASIVSGMALVGLTLRVRKVQANWAAFWKDATIYYNKVAQTTRPAKKATFLKAANLIRYFCFGECSARLLGEVVRRVGRPTIRDDKNLSAVQLRVICDTDIQGAGNIDFFDYLWGRLEGNQTIINQLGLSEHVGEVLFQTEEQEPILLLSDHLAGVIQSTTGPTAIPRPHHISANGLQEVSDAYRALLHLVTVEVDFALSHQKIFDNQHSGSPRNSSA